MISDKKIISYDEIHVKDGGMNGDTLVKAYASADDLIVVVYQNNSVTAKINGFGTSYFNGGNLSIGTSMKSVSPKYFALSAYARFSISDK